jgi:4-amino-4-deoxy-L-arabinose transferase-like glycosyltransferase
MNDLPVALGFVTTAWALDRFFRAPRWWSGPIVGLAAALALLTKFSGIFLPPLVVLLALVWIARAPGSAARRARAGQAAFALATAALTCYVAIWAAYGFRYEASPDPTYEPEAPPPDWTAGTLKARVLGAAFDRARALRALPQAYIAGLEWQIYQRSRPAFLNGRLGRGWFAYFPEAFVLKTTPGVLALLALLLVGALRRRAWKVRRWSMATWCLVLVPVAYASIAVGSRINQGHRYLLPIYPFLFVLLGRAAATLRAGGWRGAAVGALLASHAVSSAAASPRYIAYFNFIAGGSANGWRYLVDSNIDHGQDLLRLRAWLRANGVRRVYLDVCTTGDPEAYGIESEPFRAFASASPSPYDRPADDDIVLVSVSYLQGLQVDDDTARFYEAVRGRAAPLARVGDAMFAYRYRDMVAANRR